jgi:hypothetical protein
MALRIVHLCDVHSAKGEDVPAAAAHTLTADGVSFAIDLCEPCDSERWAPVVAFVQAYALQTDDSGQGAPDLTNPVDLRALLDNMASLPGLQGVTGGKGQGKAKAKAVDPAPEAAPEPEAEPSDDEPGVINGRRVLGLRKYDDEAHRQARAIVRERNRTPRVCPIDGDETVSPTAWLAHRVRPATLFGLVCPVCGHEESSPQRLGMHGRLEHDAVHTPQLFWMGDEAGDPLGILAGIRARYGAQVAS